MPAWRIHLDHLLDALVRFGSLTANAVVYRTSRRSAPVRLLQHRALRSSGGWRPVKLLNWIGCQASDLAPAAT